MICEHNGCGKIVNPKEYDVLYNTIFDDFPQLDFGYGEKRKKYFIVCSCHIVEYKTVHNKTDHLILVSGEK